MGRDSCCPRNFCETDMRASCGHSWNQLMEVQLMMAGNFLPRTLKVLPTGEKQSTTFTRNYQWSACCVVGDVISCAISLLSYISRVYL